MRSILRASFVLAFSFTLVTAGCTEVRSGGNSAPTQAASILHEQAGTDAAAAALLPPDVKSRGTLTIASATANAPMEFLDADGKTIIGFDIELSDAIAATLGLKAEHVASTFDAIIPGLQAKKYDFGISGFFITPKREKVVDFVPYLRDGSALVVPAGNPLGLRMDPATLCGRRLAGEKGSVQGLEYLPAISKDCQAAVTVLHFPTLDEAHLALTGGRADAIMEDSIPSGYRAKKSNGKFEVAPGDVYKPVTTGIAFPKDSELTTAVQAALGTLSSSGRLQALLDKWSIPSAALLASY
ncbi:ABC transporter substrate-binding protein [Kribbella sp. NPDC048915]|uniref:ABC transporter substrate-binding protein n=1 Tax=Kribbella sp. NPDC048915 TaxID=3155148 RepID=UPI0033C393C1